MFLYDKFLDFNSKSLYLTSSCPRETTGKRTYAFLDTTKYSSRYLLETEVSRPETHGRVAQGVFPFLIFPDTAVE